MNLKDFLRPEVSCRLFYQYVSQPWPVTRKQFKAAIAYYNRALSRDENNAGFHRSKGYFYMQYGDWRLALASFSKAVQLAPENPLGYLARGLLHARCDRYVKAFLDYNKGLGCAPEHAGLYNAPRQMGYRASPLGTIIFSIGRLRI